MDIHKPKPVHNLREFLSEITIIIIGVLIALGLEQVVEAWHWREEVAGEREALKAEERDGREVILARRQLQPCVERRLAEVRLVLQRHHDRQPLGIVAPIGRPSGGTLALGSWQIALASRGLAHMPLEEKLDLSGRFGSYGRLNAVLDDEQAVWTRLTVLDDAALLSDQDWGRLHDTYAQANALSHRIGLNIPFFLGLTLASSADEADDQPAELAAERQAMCQPMLAQPAETGRDKD